MHTLSFRPNEAREGSSFLILVGRIRAHLCPSRVRTLSRDGLYGNLISPAAEHLGECLSVLTPEEMFKNSKEWSGIRMVSVPGSPRESLMNYMYIRWKREGGLDSEMESIELYQTTHLPRLRQ